MRFHVAGLALAAWAASASADDVVEADAAVVESEQARFVERTVAEGLGYPWSLAFLPDGGVLLTEKDGRLRLIDDGALHPEPIAGTPEIYRRGDSGLLEVALHPDFADNALVYLSYVAGAEEANRLELMRARLEDHALVDAEVIFRANFDKAGFGHPGGRILFLADHTLLLTVGEGYDYLDEAQDPANHLGTVVRLQDDGGVPQDNPFAEGRDAAPEVWSYGHRNAQGMTLTPDGGAVWLHEHGPRGGDEINVVRAGANYGWPAVTYGIDYDGSIISEQREADGMEPPIWYWVPSIAPSGMAFYGGDAFPEWRGDLFIGGLASLSVERMEIRDGHVIGVERLLADNEERIREVRAGPDGFLYVATDSDEGRVFRLEPAP